MCYVRSAKLFFSLFLKFPNNGIRALKDLEGPVRENSFLLSWLLLFHQQFLMVKIIMYELSK